MTIPSSVWQVASGRRLPLDRPCLIGIVNATPDSFSDGARGHSVEALSGLALRLVEEGAVAIDVGGESTRPGAERVDAAEQIERTTALIEQIRAFSDVVVSIDTTHAEVARAALDAGAHAVNDVSAGREDEAMLPLVAARGAGIVLMHRRVPPGEDRYSHEYAEAPAFGDVVEDVTAFLLERAAAATAAGIERASIVLDPGLGFGKSVEQNFELIGCVDDIVRAGHPVLSGASRKSFVGAVTGVEAPRDRIVGSTAVSVAHYLRGVRLFRVHDVAAHREALAVAAAIVAARERRSGRARPVA